MAQFCARYVPNFASIVSPLWDLTGCKTEWKWCSEHEKSFNEIKSRLTSASVMAYFKPGAITRIVTDASPVGLGAILGQKQNSDGKFHPVYYASRKLTDCEKRYSQFEREALGVKWACEKFRLYLTGAVFEIRTDHKPLIKVLSPNSKPPSARIERWLLYLQQFQYSIRHIKGKDNHADMLSRLPIEDNTCIMEYHDTEEFAYSAVVNAVPPAMTASEIERETAKDSTLKIVEQCISSKNWSSLKSSPFWHMRDEFWLFGHILMRGNKVVVPETLRDKIIKLAHEGHQGMVRTKSRIRSRVWWPGMDAMVEKYVQACHPCQLVGRRPNPEPLNQRDRGLILQLIC